MSNNIENLVAEGKKCLLPGMDKDSVSIFCDDEVCHINQGVPPNESVVPDVIT